MMVSLLNKDILVHHSSNSPVLVASIYQSLLAPRMSKDKIDLSLPAHDLLPDVNHAEIFHQRVQCNEAHLNFGCLKHLTDYLMAQAQSIGGSLLPGLLRS